MSHNHVNWSALISRAFLPVISFTVTIGWELLTISLDRLLLYSNFNSLRFQTSFYVENFARQSDLFADGKQGGC